VEIIVVDDGAPDGTPSSCNRASVAFDGRPQGGRRGAQRRARRRRAKSCFQDADVVAPPEWIAKALACARKRLPCGGGGYAGPVQEIFIQQFAHEELVWRRRHHCGYVATLVSNNLWCERELFLAKGGFPRPPGGGSEDLEFSWAVSRDHKLWWAAENGVYHDSRAMCAISAQQIVREGCGADDHGQSHVGARRQTHHGTQLYVEVAFTGLGIVCPPLWLGVVAANGGFLAAVARKRGGAFAAKALGLVFLRNFSIIWGVGVGFWEYFARRRETS
jgi:glycosyltransferase involved in cell wall biosynthesis